MTGAALNHALRTKQPRFTGIRKAVVVHVEEPAAIAAADGLVEFGTPRQRLADRMMTRPNARRGAVDISLDAAVQLGMPKCRQASQKNKQ